MMSYRPERAMHHHVFYRALCVTFFLYTSKAQSTSCAYLPLHAARAPTPTDPCNWLCTDGYFQTAPPNPLDSVCRPCSRYACAIGQYTSRCYHETDSACVTCPFAQNLTYVSNRACDEVRCANGYYNSASSNAAMACSMCEQGFYCINGMRYPCSGDKELTLVAGSDAPLYCQPTYASGIVNNIVVAIQYSLTPSTAAQPQHSPDKLQTLLSWIQYGSRSTCAATTPTADSIQCWITIAPSVAGIYVLWLQTILNTNADRIKTALIDGLSPQPVTLSIISIQVMPNTAADVATQQGPSDASRIAPSKAPLLQFAPIRWGLLQQDTELSLGFVAALLSMLFIACAALVAIATVQCKYRRHVRDYLQQLTEQRRQIKRALTAL